LIRNIGNYYQKKGRIRMKDLHARVISSEILTEGFARICIEAPEIAGAGKPGQFVHVRCGRGVYSLMRRPLSIHQVKDRALVLLFQIKGEGTSWLAQRQPGEFVDLMGPLGQGFVLPEKGPVVLAAGGIGIAPLFFLARQAREKQLPVTILFGARNNETLCLLNGITEMAAEVKIATEDGSEGLRGLVTDLLKDSIKTSKPEAIYACGPEPMLKSVATIGNDWGIETQVSLEARMACGVGACRGCVTLVRKRGESVYENVCSAGPVFRGSEVVFDE
jgi:dihydroorotate dehydrogenase electron transfer subunit